MADHSDQNSFLRLPAPALRRRDVLALGAGALFAASGARAQSAGKPVPPPPAKPTGQVVVGLSQEPTVFNPLMPGIEVDETVWMQIFNTMWLADPQGNLMPDLAVEVPSEANGGISEGGLAWKVKLREGVVWQDGTPFTAEDVKYSLELINAPGFKSRTRVGHSLVRDIKVTGTHEISWRMEKAYAPYLALLANTYIVPKHLLEKASDPNTAPFNSSPVGTGPFRWGQRTPGDNIVLVANERYHGKGPYLEKAVLKYVPDQVALYAQFRTGQVDILIGTGIPANYYAEAVKLPGRKVATVPNASLEILMPNLEHPALSEKAVRQALYASINKQAIIDVIFYGLHKPTESFAPRESWAYNPDLPQQSYDLAKANKLLDEAGWKRSGSGVRMKNNVPLEFAVSTTTGSSLREQCQQLMMQDWQQVGVSMKINNMPAAVIWGEFYVRSKFQSLLVGTAFRTGIDPDPATRFASDAIPVKGGSGGNYMQWQNAEVDQLLKDGQTTFDQAKRKAIYFRLQEIVREELPILPIYQYAPVEGYKEGLVGYEPNINARQNTWNMGSWYWAR
ncbi:peptide ABC transporter substrate-binding protein [Bosea sp. (in: a-proteobacteria)]|jgi:peptide/nickel transport system substrate-binding protein|uniref:peptide ABC transporter substrate-binding protein n=1 Tax=Bosea sp. (in: a-proteobacteria) TaxID=1871050 RepID=UPI003F6FC4D7